MREIKFRGYDKEYEQMTYFEDEEYDYRPPLAFRLDQIFKKDSNYDDYEDFEYKDITDKLEIMQYTGLHDKNGKEIYESDIIKYKDSTGQHIQKVIFDKGCFYAGMHCGSSTRVAPKLINPRISEVIRKHL